MNQDGSFAVTTHLGNKNGRLSVPTMDDCQVMMADRCIMVSLESVVFQSVQCKHEIGARNAINIGAGSRGSSHSGVQMII